MTGSHEVRGSIPLGSTNHINSLQAIENPSSRGLCAYSVRKERIEVVALRILRQLRMLAPKQKAAGCEGQPLTERRNDSPNASAVEHPFDLCRGLVLHSW
jgi:hypothetical protein